MIEIIPSADTVRVERLLAPRRDRDSRLEHRVARIVDAVRVEGDAAVRRFAARFDGFAGELEIGAEAIAAGAREAPRPVRAAIAAAARHIARVARAQLPRSARVSVAPGISVEQQVRPLDRVGCYVPGGRYPLPSSLLMTAIPARVAGVGEIVAVCPKPDPVVLAAAAAAGVARLFRVGGAHAVAALAYGTVTIPRVDKIVGPGNKYVAAAKACVSRDCAIDFQAGPTEILILSDTGDPAWLAADLIAQAEHDPDARAVLITSRARLARAVAREVQHQMPLEGPAPVALRDNGGIVVTRSAAEAVGLANRMAPEHLVVDDERTARAVRYAGAIFVGAYTAQVAGDYAIGSNHVLPTGEAARFRGGLSAADFVRVVSVQRLTARGLRAIAPAVVTLATAEGLVGHARSIRVRVS
jgi:histidinol dehydrogenase